ncbi:hypothetical protein WJX72_001802 [[Myrmecia] bisecta]|uniref:Alpha-1,3-glucosyltransferase n=1 Tax=[Myrmecia] bisecta TaxID=41462 RepID=A0AAW1PGN4_9CHLO
MPAYRSTDFEVHRNWLAITSGLPLDQWYTEATSEWTLDYPPLFAWFEWLLAQAARWWEPAMLQIHNLNYASPAAVLFQRGSVILTDLVLVTAVHWATRKMRQPARSTAMFLVLASPGLLIVDHIHFQYNGMLLGLLVWSLALVREGRDLAAACMFAVLVNMKHLFASLGPVYVVYLLRHYCRGPAALRKFATLALTVVGVTALSFGPFVVPGQLMVVLQRLFPFGRGLCHAYWAANFWALYSFADKALAALLPRRGFPLRAIRASMTGGLVGVAEFAVLPQVSPPATLCCVLASMLPCLLHLWRQPHPHNFLNAICTASLCSFVFGYHVHEKAILSVTVPLALGAVESRRQAGDYLLLSAAGHAALLPLLFTAQEYPIKILLVAVYTALAFMVLDGTTSNPKRDSEQHSTPAGQLAGERRSLGF